MSIMLKRFDWSLLQFGPERKIERITLPNKDEQFLAAYTSFPKLTRKQSEQ